MSGKVSTSQPYDALIIGAGPAGCAAAILLARGGWSVRIVEQHRFPRDKVCGECLSSMGFDVLARLGLAEQFFALSPTELSAANIHSSAGKCVAMKLPRPMWGVSRMAFDAMLLGAARESGAEILQPARCEQIEPEIVVRQLDNNQRMNLRASHVLLADGKRSLTANRPAATKDLGIKAHFENVVAPRDAIELFGVCGHYGGVAAIEGGRWNVAFSVPKQRVADHAGDIDAIFVEMLNENRSLRQRFGAARRVSSWLTSPLPRFAPPRALRGNTIPIGNAAAAIEPIGGEGMGLAMRSAEIAAQMLLSGSRDTIRLSRSFQMLWRSRRFGCRAAAMIVSRPRMMNLLSPTIGRVEILQRSALRCIGKNAEQIS